MQVRLLQQTAMCHQTHLKKSQFFLDKNTQQYIKKYLSFLRFIKGKNFLKQCCLETDSASRPTLCQHNKASYHYNKNDEKFGCSEDVLHVSRQFDTQTVHNDDQRWKDMRNITFLDIWNEVHLSKKVINSTLYLTSKMSLPLWCTWEEFYIFTIFFSLSSWTAIKIYSYHRLSHLSSNQNGSK